MAYQVNVYLPDSYATELSKNYPVLYVIDGGTDQDFKHIAGLGALASINPYAFKPAIVVGVETKQRLFELTSINLDPRYNREKGELGGSEQFRAYIRNAVIPFVDKKFRTSTERIVMGESLAGLFIMETFLKEPSLFSSYVSISPSLWYDDRRLAKSAKEYLTSHKDKPINLYVSMADEGGTMQKGLDEILAAVSGSKLKNLRLNYQDRRDSEFHWTIYHQAALEALQWILPAAAPDFTDQPDPWYMIEGASPPDWKEQK